MTTTIRKMRAVGTADDPLLIRLRLERALGTADLHVPGMPPAVILCVRRLPDPLPGRLDLDALTPQRAWQDAMQAALGRMAQHAARPALGAPPPDTPAVWFEDRAELLACLARDWCTGALAEHWWWRTLLHDRGAHAGDLTSRLYAAWRATPEAIPAALALLHDCGDCARFLALLPSAEVRALTSSAAAAFGLPMLERTRDVTTDHQRHVTTPAAASLAILDRAADVRVLDPERRALYAAGVLLACAPMLARAAWPVAINRWAYADDPASHADHPPPLSEAPDAAESVLEQVTSVPFVATNDLVASAVASTAIQPEGDAPPAVAAPDIAPTQLFVPRDAELRPAERLQTQFGGMLFLLNLALHLDLYGDFTRPLHVGIGLSPWALLAQLGPHLLPAAALDDPLWPLLAELAGDTPEADFTPPRRWRVPHAWLTPFGVRTRYQLTHCAGWLQLAHPAGFIVLEQRSPLSRQRRRFSGSPVLRFCIRRPSSVVRRPSSVVRRPSFVVRRPSSVVRRPSSIVRRSSSSPPDTPAGWIERLAGYARARLALALGGADEVARALALPARIYAGDVRVDVMFSLNELPIAVRLAGLDRNPGWVPSAGRDIRFHFE